jgi:hypothetical protein
MTLEAEIPMAKNSNETCGPAEVQVFELTMDNDEDQDDLNRRLRKPGEADCSQPSKPVKAADSSPPGVQGKPTTEPQKGEPH